jgi:hypothetical protein
VLFRSGIVGRQTNASGGVERTLNAGAVEATEPDAAASTGAIVGSAAGTDNVSDNYYLNGLVASDNEIGTGLDLFDLKAKADELFPADTAIAAFLDMLIDREIEKARAKIETTGLAAGKVGVAYSAGLAASGDAPIAWSIDGGNLPAGLALNPASGVISGVPTTAGTSSFTVKAQGAIGGPDAKALSIRIDSASTEEKVDEQLGGTDNNQQTSGEQTKIVSDLSNATVSLASTAVWTGGQIRPAVTVNLGGLTLPAAGYTVSYGANKDIGKGTVTITAASGAYSGGKTATFSINPKDVKVKTLTPGKKRLSVKWAKAAPTQKLTGYQIQYRVKGKAKWSASKTVKKASSVNYTVKSLKKGKRYEVRVRAYKNIASGASKGSYYGAWSKVKASGKVK